MKNTINTAVILAAGRGSRLLSYSDDFPKPMLKIHEISIINKLIQNLDQLNVEKIVVITGYKYQILENHILEFKKSKKIKLEIVFIRNLIYDKTNNIYSLWLAKEYLRNGFYLLEADIFCTKYTLSGLINSDRDNIAIVAKFLPNMNGTVISFKDQNKIEKMILKKEQSQGFSYQNKYKTVNFYKIGRDFARSYFLEYLQTEIELKNTNSYYEIIIKKAIEDGISIYPLILCQEKWWEIDTPEDLEYAKKIFKL